ncbi:MULTISPECIES: hypothetical protein [Helicobacter]|nr:hypothetical protein [Helicobacter sp. MIT 03-1616]
MQQKSHLKSQTHQDNFVKNPVASVAEQSKLPKSPRVKSLAKNTHFQA